MERYQNKHVQSIMDAMHEAKNEFSERRKGPEWVGILYALGAVFPEDRATIIGNYERKPEKPAQTTEKANIATPDVADEPRYGDCEDCPGGQVYQPHGMGPRVKPLIVGLSTVDRVMAEFQGDADLMRAHLDALGVEHHARSGASKLAGQIAGYYAKG